MTNTPTPDFVFIDDDAITLKMYNIIFHRILPLANVKTFTDPERGIEHIYSTYDLPDAGKVVLFLDINMPGLNGWQVLDQLRYSPAVLKGKMRTFMLSSSIDTNDMTRAEADPMVRAFISKPLSMADVRIVLSKYYDIVLE